ncbi:MarR family winged helix-turn-helix transcriptional regulator [Vibrio sp. RC27]
MNTPKELKLDNQICHSLYSANNALIRAYRPLLDKLDLTYPQYLVMLALWEEDGVIIKRLVERTRLDAGTLTPIIKRLETKLLIEKVKSEQDSRQTILKVSKNGRSLQQQAASVPKELACQINMPIEEALELKALTERLYQKLSSQ